MIDDGFWYRLPSDFRAPPHTISEAGLLGGSAIPAPGKVSLAHHGVLFPDELPEFKRSTLEVMRQPLEERRVNISRAAGAITLPSEFILVAAMNPCPREVFTNLKLDVVAHFSESTPGDRTGQAPGFCITKYVRWFYRLRALSLGPNDSMQGIAVFPDDLCIRSGAVGFRV